MKRALQLIRLRLSREWLIILLIAVVSTLAAAVWWEFDVLEISDDERSAYDDGLKAFTLPKRDALKFVQNRFGLGKPTRSEDIIVVALDDATMTRVTTDVFLQQRYGKNLPFDRVVWADLISYLSAAGAKGIVFDMVMNEASSDGIGDKALGEAIDAAQTPVILGFNTSPIAEALPQIDAGFDRPVGKMPSYVKEVGPDEFPEDPTPEEQREIDKKVAADRLAWAAKAYALPIEIEDLETPSFPAELERTEFGDPTGKEFAQLPMPAMPAVLESADGFGTVTSEEDEDGKLRRTGFVYSDGQNTYATLPVTALARFDKASKIVLAPGKLTIGERAIRINRDGTAEINYGGRLAERFRMVPLYDVVARYHFCSKRTGKTDQVEYDCPNGEIAKDPQGALFKDKYVLVGQIAVGTGDSKATPLEQSTPGLVKQAAVLDNLLHDRFIIAAPLWMSLLFTFFVALFSVTLVLVVRNAFVDIGWPVLLYVGFFLFTGAFLVGTGEHVLSAMPSLAGTLASILATSWERLFAGKDRERLKEMFQNYMEPDLVEIMVEQKTLPTLGGENLEVTAFFSDIRGFSTFSERLRAQPQVLIRVLNRYLSTVTPVLTREGACIDKYIGDAVVAIFGAPVREPDHALRACRAALEVQQALFALREEFGKQGLPDVYTRIGLNTGQMMVGNIGSDQLLDYTAIGDEMNLAARLEGANKNYGTLIMIGPGTYAAVKNQVEVRELDRIRVAGKTQAATVYELLAMKGRLPEQKAKVVDLYGRALFAYRARRFSEAKGVLGEALRLDPNDGPSKRLSAVCMALEQNPPPPEWDAVSMLDK